MKYATISAKFSKAGELISMKSLFCLSEYKFSINANSLGYAITQTRHLDFAPRKMVVAALLFLGAVLQLSVMAVAQKNPDIGAQEIVHLQQASYSSYDLSPNGHPFVSGLTNFVVPGASGTVFPLIGKNNTKWRDCPEFVIQQMILSLPFWLDKTALQYYFIPGFDIKNHFFPFHFFG